MSKPTPTEVGERIRRLREEKGLSQASVVEPNFSGSYLSLIEAGRRMPTPAALEHIAERLGVNVEDLTGSLPRGFEAHQEFRLQQARHALHAGELALAQQLAAEVAASAAEHSLSRLEARALELSAAIAEERRDLDTAFSLYQGAEVLWRSEPVHLRHETVAGLARCYASRGDPRYGIHLLEAYLRELGEEHEADPRARMRALSALVPLYRSRAMIGQSVEVAEAALRIAPHVHDAEQVACMNMNVARVLLDEGRHTDALEALRRAEEIFLSLDWNLAAGRAQTNRAIVEAEKGDLEEAEHLLRSAANAFARTHGGEADRVYALNELGRIQRLSGRTDAAMASLFEARSELDRTDPMEVAINARELGLCLADKDPEAARRELAGALDAFRVADAPKEVAATLRELGRVALKAGDSVGAATAFEQAIDEVLEHMPH